MTTYTVMNGAGTVQASGCTLEEAANEVLTYDDYAFEIRRAEPRWDVHGEPQWQLWHSDGSAASTRSARHLVLTRIGVYAATKEAAWPGIAAEVIANADWFKGCTVMTDADYDAMLAEIAADETPRG